jgi:hypothetical protein
MSNRITHRTINQTENRTNRIDPKLSNEQIYLLLWLANGNSIDMCTEVCPDLGTVAELEGFAGHFLKRTIYRLKREGLTQERDLFVTGLRWTSLTLNSKGRSLAEQLGEQNHA